MTITEYIDQAMCDDPTVKGFTIGRGKKIYWYITPMPSGVYQCLPFENDNTLGWPRMVTYDQIIQVIAR